MPAPGKGGKRPPDDGGWPALPTRSGVTLTPAADSGRGKGDRVNVRFPGTPPEDVPRGKGDKGKLQSPVTPEKGASKGIPRVPGASTLTAPDASERLGIGPRPQAPPIPEARTGRWDRKGSGGKDHSGANEAPVAGPLSVAPSTLSVGPGKGAASSSSSSVVQSTLSASSTTARPGDAASGCWLRFVSSGSVSSVVPSTPSIIGPNAAGIVECPVDDCPEVDWRSCGRDDQELYAGGLVFHEVVPAPPPSMDVKDTTDANRFIDTMGTQPARRWTCKFLSCMMMDRNTRERALENSMIYVQATFEVALNDPALDDMPYKSKIDTIEKHGWILEHEIDDSKPSFFRALLKYWFNKSVDPLGFELSSTDKESLGRLAHAFAGDPQVSLWQWMRRFLHSTLFLMHEIESNLRDLELTRSSIRPKLRSYGEDFRRVPLEDYAESLWSDESSDDEVDRDYWDTRAEIPCPLRCGSATLLNSKPALQLTKKVAKDWAENCRNSYVTDVKDIVAVKRHLEQDLAKASDQTTVGIDLYPLYRFLLYRGELPELEGPTFHIWCEEEGFQQGAWRARCLKFADRVQECLDENASRGGKLAGGSCAARATTDDKPEEKVPNPKKKLTIEEQAEADEKELKFQADFAEITAKAAAEATAEAEAADAKKAHAAKIASTKSPWDGTSSAQGASAAARGSSESPADTSNQGASASGRAELASASGSADAANVVGELKRLQMEMESMRATIKALQAEKEAQPVQSRRELHLEAKHDEAVRRITLAESDPVQEHENTLVQFIDGFKEFILDKKGLAKARSGGATASDDPMGSAVQLSEFSPENLAKLPSGKRNAYAAQAWSCKFCPGVWNAPTAECCGQMAPDGKGCFHLRARCQQVVRPPIKEMFRTKEAEEISHDSSDERDMALANEEVFVDKQLRETEMKSTDPLRKEIERSNRELRHLKTEQELADKSAWFCEYCGTKNSDSAWKCVRNNSCQKPDLQREVSRQFAKKHAEWESRKRYCRKEGIENDAGPTPVFYDFRDDLLAKEADAQIAKTNAERVEKGLPALNADETSLLARHGRSSVKKPKLGGSEVGNVGGEAIDEDEPAKWAKQDPGTGSAGSSSAVQPRETKSVAGTKTRADPPWKSTGWYDHPKKAASECGCRAGSESGGTNSHSIWLKLDGPDLSSEIDYHSGLSEIATEVTTTEATGKKFFHDLKGRVKAKGAGYLFMLGSEGLLDRIRLCRARLMSGPVVPDRLQIEDRMQARLGGATTILHQRVRWVLRKERIGHLMRLELRKERQMELPCGNGAMSFLLQAWGLKTMKTVP
ncbi:unnamed protein product [Polarella glacialis]|uniref:Uncharacterized protein n=1 Tax=Polarella glacialis TaxID=89957 RepID=A0A813HBY4_POLGL|nr:unnamed protein product [Polarella glacialis]